MLDYALALDLHNKGELQKLNQQDVIHDLLVYALKENNVWSDGFVDALRLLETRGVKGAIVEEDDYINWEQLAKQLYNF